jgi:hypothetical protein
MTCAHREDFRNRLDRDFGLQVAGRMDLPVGGHEREPEDIRVDLGQRRNIVAVLAVLQRSILVVGRLESALDSSRRQLLGGLRDERD